MQGMERDSKLKSEAHISCARPLMKSLLWSIALNWGQCQFVLSSESIQTLSGEFCYTFSIKELLSFAQQSETVHNCEEDAFILLPFSYTHF